MSTVITDATKRDSYTFELKFQTKDQRPLGRERLSPRDLDRALFATWFAGLRHGQFRDFQPVWDRSWVEPLFTEDSAPGRARGFRVGVETGADPQVLEFGLDYFSSRATRRRVAMLRDKTITDDDEVFFYLDCFYEDAAPPEHGMSLSVSEACGSVPIRDGCFHDFSEATAWDQPDSADPTVVIPKSVIDEAVEETRAAPDREIGGLLLGHIHRDRARQDVFVEVTACVSAAGTTDATATSVTFTPESFRKARDLIRLRDRGEIILGWQHSHPMRFCQECPLPTPVECLRKILFFSMDDVQLMETTFPQPFQLGLLTAVEPRLDAALGHAPVRLFGWRHAEIQARGFQVISD